MTTPQGGVSPAFAGLLVRYRSGPRWSAAYRYFGRLEAEIRRRAALGRFRLGGRWFDGARVRWLGRDRRRDRRVDRRRRAGRGCWRSVRGVVLRRSFPLVCGGRSVRSSRRRPAACRASRTGPSLGLVRFLGALHSTPNCGGVPDTSLFWAATDHGHYEDHGGQQASKPC